MGLLIIDEVLKGLIVGGISYGLYGIYVTTLILSTWSSTWRRDGSKPVTKNHVQLISWVTALLITFRQITITAFITSEVCLLPSPDDDTPLCMANHDRASYEVVGYEIPQMMNLYIPPLVALLSDGILAWRVYHVWNRPVWLRYVLSASLLLNCVIGLAMAVWMSSQLDAKTYPDSITLLYQAWAWIAFVLNSTMSISILVRIRKLGDINRQGPSLRRYITVIRAIIESAVLSWIATLSCAIAWTWGFGSSLDHVERVWASVEINMDTAGRRFATIMFLALPTLLGISQVLIITRVNISKFDTTAQMTQSISVLTDHWDAMAPKPINVTPPPASEV